MASEIEVMPRSHEMEFH